MDPITENPAIGATEVWEFYNGTIDAHPMHIHEVVFEVVNRQAIFVNEGAQTVQVVRVGPTPPEPWETGYKDTVIALPGQVTRVRAKFITPGQFVWHCHIVEHEDNEMMRPYSIDGTAGFPRTPVIDNFNRPNGKIDSGWNGNVASYAIASQEAKGVRTGTGAIFWKPQKSARPRGLLHLHQGRPNCCRARSDFEAYRGCPDQEQRSDDRGLVRHAQQRGLRRDM